MDEVEDAAATTSASLSPSSPDVGAGFKRFRDESPSPVATLGTKRKSRKSTHTARKEEKEQLQCEIALLQAQMEMLQRRAFSEAQRYLAADVVHSVLQQQLAHFVDAQMLFSALGMTQVVSPIAMPVRLSQDRHERVATLAAMKDARLRSSRAFLTRRCGALDPHKSFAEDQRFETANGDYCVVRCSRFQLEGAQSVRQVFDILQFYSRHIEISTTERLGRVTIREDDDDVVTDNVFQNRLVGAPVDNVLVESNTVLFAEFIDRGDGDSNGFITSEFVDEDALYPYRPDQRLRKDTSFVLQVAPLAPLEPTQPLVVVLTRWSYSRLHRPAFPVATAAMDDVRDNLANWCETTITCLRESLHTED